MQTRAHRRTILLVALLAGALLGGAAYAKGQLSKLAAFTAPGAEMQVLTFEDQGKRVALFGIINGSTRNSFTANLSELPGVIELWKKALAARSPAWKTVGSQSETDTSDRSRLTLSAGPGIRFVIDSPKGQTETFTMENGDAARFEEALGKAKEALENAPVK